MSSLIAAATRAWRHAMAADREAALVALASLSDEEREVVSWQLDNGHADELLDAFRSAIAFGTGGVRGPVGLGPNRVNPAVVAEIVAGHAAVLVASGASAAVVGYDGRRFDDVERRWHQRLPRWSSRDFALIAAQTYARAGLTVWLAPLPVPTPAVSWITRNVMAGGAAMITASHNPPDDNGVKLFDHDGVQLVAPADDAVIAARGATPIGGVLGDVRPWASDWLARFLALVTANVPSGPPARVAVSALHGVGRVSDALRHCGHVVVDEPRQAVVDGAFPTLVGGIANPERDSVWPLVLACADAHHATLALTSDPDGDRLGVAVRHAGAWRRLSGDQVAVLLVQARVEALGGDASGWLVARTCVTSSLVDAVARSAGARVIGDLPVGFKHLMDAARAQPEPLLVAVEESCGAWLAPGVGDKDAHGAAAWITHAHRAACARGQSLMDVFATIEERFGAVRTGAARVDVSGSTRREGVAAIMAAARADAVIADRAVTSRVDLAVGAGATPSARLARELVVLELAVQPGEASARLIVRPSGTEPIVKLYVEVRGGKGAAPDVEGLVAACADWARSKRA